MPPRGERALPVLAGILLAAAYPPVRLVLPAFVGLVPLLVFIAERPPGATGRWSATRAGIVTGLVYFGLQLYWMVVALSQYSSLAIPAYALTVVVLAGLTGAFGWGLHYTSERLGLPLVLTAALLWTTMEWVQGRLGDFAFPWLGLAYALTPYPILAGAADLVGARGLTLWIAGVNGLLAMALVRARAGVLHPGPDPGRGPAPILAAALLLAAVPAGYGVWRAATLELLPVARVAVVQPNIPQHLRFDAALTLDTSMTMLTRLTLNAVREDPERHEPVQGTRQLDLVAWPEVALTAELADEPTLTRTVRHLSARIDAPILVGAYGTDGAGRLYNSAFLIGEDGVRGPRYDKRRLVPFVERVPLRATGRRFGGLERGRDAPLFRTASSHGRADPTGPVSALAVGPDRPAGAAFGVLICYEAIFADLARSYRRSGADYLVNITNDGWFGRDTPYGRTTALWQHPAHVTMRAIENRIGVARAANTGISMFVDPLGRTRQGTPLFVHDVRVETVLTTRQLTLYTRWGDWLTTLTALATLALLLVARLAPRGHVRTSKPGRPRAST
jgi:apolipoprotein N-acyltransferase